MAGRHAMREFLDMSSFTDNYTKWELEQKTLSNALAWDVYGGKTEFVAKVLSPPINLAQADAAAADGTATRTADEIQEAGTRIPAVSNKFAFKARILGNPSPHDFIGDPCELSTADNPQQAYRLIALHTTFITADDPNAEPTSLPKVGDFVNVELDVDQFSYNLQFGKYIGIATNTTAGMTNASTDSLSERLAEQAREGGADVPEPPLTCFHLTDLFSDFDPGIFANNDGTTVYSTGNNPLDVWGRIGGTVAGMFSSAEEGAGSLSELLDFIAAGEGGYNSMNQGTVGNRIVGSTHDASTILGQNLTQMSIQQILDFQALPRGSATRLFAAGRYQIIPDTMRFAIQKAGARRSDTFNEAMQDRLGEALVLHKRPALRRYLIGESDDIQEAMLDFAREWASVPDPRTGNSYYGSGNRSAHTVEEVRTALIRARGTMLGDDD